ncbi:CHAT domain-containing protein [Leptolyngbya sp. CCNP1308]|uniref:CHAT domain-containing protein n=1 Tax=Leptolyngbya sp. CCNP1308 TaxID=3110255 RepID=UPI002B1F897B|nr:CHAT domain-containing protein [Leptolyngbya sp. CCNP1308]MEA5447552.1 CHAT domain-containing protein [Leptolyngbya sp. CCNP1308]
MNRQFRKAHYLISLVTALALVSGAPGLTESNARSFDMAQADAQTDMDTGSDKTQEAEQIFEELVEQVDELEKLYRDAKSDFQAGDYAASEAKLRWVISRSVDPSFPKTEPDPKYEGVEHEGERPCDAPSDVPLIGWLFRGLCQVNFWFARIVTLPLLQSTEQLFFGESTLSEEDFPELFKDGDIRARLQENAERAHRTTSNSIKLLQQILVVNGDRNQALEIAELSREFEYVRISPLLNAGAGLSEPAIPDRVSVADIKKIANEQNSTIVYYSLINDREIYAWVVRPNARNPEFKILPIAPTEIISEQVDRTRQAASSNVDRGDGGAGAIVWKRGDLRSSDTDTAVSIMTEDEQTQTLKGLYRSIIAPIDEYFPAPNSDPAIDSHVVFIPQGPLFGVPFAALQNEFGDYLIDQYTIRVAPNFKTLSQSARTLNEFPKEDAILFVGNPDMPTVQRTENDAPQKLPSLPGAQTEVNVISRLFASEPLTGIATKAAVRQKMANASVIHLATHGILDSRNLALTNADLGKIIEDEYGYGAHATEYFSKLADDLLPGAIALTPEGRDDGLLRASELLGLELDAELVVLSACNTARGISGESTILGLPFSLGAAGASRVVVSLWSVPDKPTQELMRVYYAEMYRQSIYEDSIDPAGALRKAMQEIKSNEKYKDPINWAGFTLIEVSQED